jgi:asparagine synthase (glutamine-hydrolysing)
MCGIVGILSFGGKIEKDIVKRMCRALYHRGPDEEGFYFEEDHLGIGARRLSIIDLVTGTQPIHNEDHSVWVVQNGEIYNFCELREVLKKRGHRFYTKTDTEVIVHLYEDFGDEFVHHINGMFAMALWDKEKRRLLLIRDRFGIKPLHYTEIESTIIFSSEIKGLLVHPKVERRIDLSSLSNYLQYEYIPAPATIFSRIKKLLAGHILVAEKGRTSLKRYWSLSFSERDVSEREAIEELKSRFSKAVKRRLVADVPLGIFLSGGIDSSSIVCMVSRNQRPKTFSIGFSEPSFDETRFSREVAEHLDTEHHHHTLSAKDLLSIIPRIVDFLDEPLGDASIVPTYLLSQFTRESCKVALSGDGGDELFAGYPTYIAHKAMGYYDHLPRVLQSLIKKTVDMLPVSFSNISLDFRLKRFAEGARLHPARRNIVWLGSFTERERRELCLWRDERDCLLDAEAHFSSIDSRDLLQKLLGLDIRFYLGEDLLTKVDRASMAVSLEVRVPFLDHELAQFVVSLPSKLKLRGFCTKYILKRAMSKELPKRILYRKKKGFGIPVARWANRELKELILDTFSREKIEKEGMFSSDYVERMLKDHFEKRRDNRKLIWTLLIFELWYQRWAKG